MNKAERKRYKLPTAAHTHFNCISRTSMYSKNTMLVTSNLVKTLFRDDPEKPSNLAIFIRIQRNLLM